MVKIMRFFPSFGSNEIKNNNFDFLRLLFAMIVCLSHCQNLTGMEELRFYLPFLSAEIAVKSFFVISGFLIFMSYERSTSLKSYAIKRLRRIYPAYFTIIVSCAILFAGISSLSISDYLSADLLKYLAANLSFGNFLQHSLPGVFESNPLNAVNGALWTLKIEVMFYVTVPIIVYLSTRIGRLPCLLIFYLLSSLFAYGCMKLGEHTGAAYWDQIGRQLPGQLSFFIAGGLIYYYRDHFKQHIKIYGGLAMLYVGARCFTGSLPLLEPAAIAILVSFFGLFFYMGRFGKYGDFSYGAYIVHFPLIQTFIHLGWLQSSPYLFVTSIAALTLILGAIMWHLIEKRFLLRTSHYVKEAQN